MIKKPTLVFNNDIAAMFLFTNKNEYDFTLKLPGTNGDYKDFTFAHEDTVRLRILNAIKFDNKIHVKEDQEVEVVLFNENGKDVYYKVYQCKENGLFLSEIRQENKLVFFGLKEVDISGHLLTVEKKLYEFKIQKDFNLKVKDENNDNERIDD